MNLPDIEKRLRELEKTVVLQARLIEKLGELGAAHQRSIETLAAPILNPAQAAAVFTQN